MSNTNLRNPLLQSAGVVAAVVVLILIIGSSGSSSAGGGIVALFAGLGNAILFVLGMSIAVALSITILIGIFLAAVAMSNKDEASQMYAGLKKNFAARLLALSCTSCNDNNAIGITEEEYEAMKEELSTLQANKNKLQAKLDSVLTDNTEMQNSVSSLDTDNATLKTKVDELSGTVVTLQESEAKINELVAQLSAKVEDTNDQELKDQISALEQMQSTTKSDIEAIGARLAEVEEKIAKAATPVKRNTPAKKTTATKAKPKTTRTKK